MYDSNYSSSQTLVNIMMFGSNITSELQRDTFLFLLGFFLGVCESYNKKKSPKKSYFLNEEDDAKSVKK